MNYSVYIRPLVIEDAHISYRWRNNPKIWKYTGTRPDKLITPEIERAWLANVLQRENEKRFAICLEEDHSYIGNIYLTDIQDGKAKIHIFIGDIANWGKRRAYEAIVLLIEYGFSQLNLKQIYCDFDIRNQASKALAQFLGSYQKDFTDPATGVVMQRWALTRQMYNEHHHMNLLLKTKED